MNRNWIVGGLSATVLAAVAIGGYVLEGFDSFIKKPEKDGNVRGNNTTLIEPIPAIEEIIAPSLGLEEEIEEPDFMQNRTRLDPNTPNPFPYKLEGIVQGFDQMDSQIYERKRARQGEVFQENGSLRLLLQPRLSTADQIKKYREVANRAGPNDKEHELRAKIPSPLTAVYLDGKIDTELHKGDIIQFQFSGSDKKGHSRFRIGDDETVESSPSYKLSHSVDNYGNATITYLVRKDHTPGSRFRFFFTDMKTSADASQTTLTIDSIDVISSIYDLDMTDYDAAFSKLKHSISSRDKVLIDSCIHPDFRDTFSTMYKTRSSRDSSSDAVTFFATDQSSRVVNSFDYNGEHGKGRVFELQSNFHDRQGYAFFKEDKGKFLYAGFLKEKEVKK